MIEKMRTAKLLLAAITLLIIAACGASKKSITTIPPVTPPAPDLLSAKPANGIYAPGNEELAAIRARYSDVTLDQLKQGHMLYTQGACINCHGAKNIYTRDEAQWKYIIDDMAQAARISDEQKDAVYKYVLAIKATQPK